MAFINWNEIFESGRDYKLISDIFLNKILAEAPNAKSALDVGCGTGDLACKLSSKGLVVTGIDQSEVAIHKAKERCSKVNFRALNIDTGNDQLAGQKFDMIFCKLVYAFINDKQNLIQFVKNTLNKEGMFVLITPVLYEDREYQSQRIKNISVEFENTQALLRKNFDEVKVFHQEFFEEEGSEVTFLCSK